MELLRRGFEVFIPAIDTGVDFLLRKVDASKVSYFEAQVKSVRSRGGRLTILKSSFTPRSNFFLIFVYLREDGQQSLSLSSISILDMTISEVW